jgi:ATP-dependent exoDNAse (exonuclease V) beta subunit
VQVRIAAGASLSDFAVLVRNRWIARDVQAALKQRQVSATE